MPTFGYPAIRASDGIRLIEIVPSQPEADILTLRIEEVSLSADPHFVAISYAWEGQEPSAEIRIGDKSLRVTKNCDAILRYLAANAKASSWIWIDAICINQSPDSIQERNHQVGMMGRIYGKANQVLVWLGTPETCTMQEALQGLADFAHVSDNKDSSQYRQKLIDAVEKIDVEGHPLLGCFAHLMLTVSTALDKIFWGLSWFSRVWVIQVCTYPECGVFRLH